ncbi:MAG: type II secretion system F family protein [Actinomycetota bacterium]|nr:type II secretion system F family protein [Actinomycetota bacterium]
MSAPILIAIVAAGLGVAICVIGMLWRVRERERQLAEILELPYGERDVRVEALTESKTTHSALVEGTVGLAGKVVDRFDDKGAFTIALERARIPMRPGEYVVITLGFTLALAAFLYVITEALFFAVVAAIIGPLVSAALVKRRVASRRKAFESQLPDALTLIASSLSAGHTFLRAIQMMCEESEPPLAEEFGRVVSETRLGDSVVDALERMAQRLEIRDLDWIVQAIRIQQQVGGRLADVLHTLADFIRAREEVRREVQVLSAEGRVSAYVLAALAPFMFLAIQIINPGYLDPMYSGWGLVTLGLTAGFMTVGTVIIFRMVKIEV